MCSGCDIEVWIKGVYSELVCLVLIWICVPDAALLACVRMAGFKGVDARWGFVYGEDQLLYILNFGHIHPVLNRATVSPFHSDREYHPASSLISISQPRSLHRMWSYLHRPASCLLLF